MKSSFNQRLREICEEKNNRLCIGLDIDPDLLPESVGGNIQNIEQFLKEIIDQTILFCPVYKPNFAFYEQFGSTGYALLERIVDYISGKAIVIADAKRGDIGNTSKKYATSILQTMGCDAITISPYMGRDSIEPFIEFKEKGVFVLALTSNQSAFEIQNNNNKFPIYEKIINISNELNKNDNLGLVVGATNIKSMLKIREISKSMSWLIPGVGSQGGDIQKSVSIGNQNSIGIINVSRGILYAGNGSLNDIVESAKNYTQQIRTIICNPVTC